MNEVERGWVDRLRVWYYEKRFVKRGKDSLGHSRLDYWVLGWKHGMNQERKRILILLNNPEWHEESKSYQRPDTDMAHDSDYCWGCQLAASIKEGK
jgi:hypothetical protein